MQTQLIFPKVLLCPFIHSFQVYQRVEYAMYRKHEVFQPMYIVENAFVICCCVHTSKNNKMMKNIRLHNFGPKKAILFLSLSLFLSIQFRPFYFRNNDQQKNSIDPCAMCIDSFDMLVSFKILLNFSLRIYPVAHFVPYFLSATIYHKLKTQSCSSQL